MEPTVQPLARARPTGQGSGAADFSGCFGYHGSECISCVGHLCRAAGLGHFDRGASTGRNASALAGNSPVFAYVRADYLAGRRPLASAGLGGKKLSFHAGRAADSGHHAAAPAAGRIGGNGNAPAVGVDGPVFVSILVRDCRTSAAYSGGGVVPRGHFANTPSSQVPRRRGRAGGIVRTLLLPG